MKQFYNENNGNLLIYIFFECTVSFAAHCIQYTWSVYRNEMKSIIIGKLK